MSQQVLIPGIDPTAFTSITGAQLAEMVSGATFATGVGGIIVSTDVSGVPVVPQAQADTTLQTYIWIRIGNPGSSGNFATAYVWNPNLPNSVGSLLNWNTVSSSSIGAQSIQGYQIASDTIPASCLQGGITLSQVTFANLITTALNTNTIFTGAVNGTINGGLSIAPGAINSLGQFVAGIISNNTLFSGQCILPSNIDTVASNAPANSILQCVSGNPGLVTWQTNALISAGQPTSGGLLPVSTAANTVAWEGISTVLSGYTLTSSACIQTILITNSSISAISVAGTVYTITLTSGIGLPSGTFPVTFSGGTGNGTNLNGSWLATLVDSTHFTVAVATSTTSGSVTKGSIIGAAFSLLTGSLNISSISAVSTGSTGLGQLAINFTAAYSNTNFVSIAQFSDSASFSTQAVKVITKNTGSLALVINNGSAGIVPTSAGFINLLCS